MAFFSYISISTLCSCFVIRVVESVS